MDLLTGIFKEHGADLASKLTVQTGFSADQATRFLPEAGSAMLDAFKSGETKLDLDNVASAGNVDALLAGIDTEGLASKVGVSPELGASGLSAVVPPLLGLLGSDAGALAGLKALMSGSDAGGMLGKMGGMLGQ